MHKIFQKGYWKKQHRQCTLSVTAMGGGMRGPAYEKHQIKRAD